MSISVKNISVSIGGARSNKFNIEISGSKFTMSNFSLSERLMAHCSLSFTLVCDPLETIADTQFQVCADIIGKEVELSLQTDPMEMEMPGFSGGDKAADIEFKGFVKNAGASRDNTHYTIRVEAMSWDALLDDNPDCRSYLDKTLKDIVEDNLADCGQLDFQVDPAFADDPYVYCVKWNETSFNFLRRLAIRHGEWLFSDGKKLFFGKMPEKEGVQLDYPSHDMTNYSISMDVQHLNFNHVGANEVLDISATHKNQDEMSDMLNQLNEAVFNASKEKYTRNSVENIVGGGFTWEQNGEESFIKQLDTPMAKGAKVALLTYHGSTSCSKLSVGVKLTVQDNYISDQQTNAKSDVTQDEILITGVIHTFNSDETYQNIFTGLAANSKFPPYTNAAAVPRARACRAWVTDNDDPERMGRVRVIFPWGVEMPNNDREKMQTPWIRVEQVYAGCDRGAYIIPEEGEEVMVDFEDDNAEMPYVRSSLFNCQQHMDNKWADDNTVPPNEVKAIRTRNGHTIEVHDKKKGGYIKIYDYQKNNYIITFSTDKKLIRLQSSGNIELDAANDIIMHAGHDMKITVDNDTTMETKHDETVKVTNNMTQAVGVKYSFTVDGNLDAAPDAAHYGTTITGGKTTTFTDNEELTVRQHSKILSDTKEEEATNEFFFANRICGISMAGGEDCVGVEAPNFAFKIKEVFGVDSESYVLKSEGNGFIASQGNVEIGGAEVHIN